MKIRMIGTVRGVDAPPKLYSTYAMHHRWQLPIVSMWGAALMAFSIAHFSAYAANPTEETCRKAS